MKFLATAVLTLTLSASPARAALIAFYPFNDGTAADASGNGNNGVLSANPPTFTAAGFQGGAFDFNAGLNNFITIPVNINPGALPQITMGGWFNSDVADATIRGLLSHDNGGFDRTLDIDVRGGTGVRWSTFTGSGVLGGSPVVAGQWTFVALRHNQATGTLVLDVGGNRFAAAGAFFGTGLGQTTIGRNPNFDLPFDGRIDNVFIFNEFLSDARIDDIRARGEAALFPAQTAVPEPAGLALLGVGAAGLTGCARLRRRTA